MYGYSDALHQSWETEWIPESQLSTSLNTQGIPQSMRAKQWDSCSHQMPCCKNFLGYTRLTASVNASLFCSSWASKSFCWDKKVAYWWKLYKLRGKSKLSDSSEIELPSTAYTLESLRKLGTSPRIFQQQSVERWWLVKILPPSLPPLIPGLNNRDKK